MKNLYAFIIGLFIGNGVIGQGSYPVLSFNGSKQVNNKKINLIPQYLYSEKITQDLFKQGEREKSTMNTIINVEQNFNCKSPNNKYLIQIYDSIYNWVWDTASLGWLIDSKTINMVYNAHNDLTNKTIQNWNDSTWENSSQYTYVFNANNLCTSITVKDWNGSNWINYEKAIFTYNPDNNLASVLWLVGSGSSWENFMMRSFTYDINNNLLTDLFRFWVDNTWDLVLLVTYTYDADNNLISELFQDRSGGTWVNNQLVTYTYDASNDRINALDQKWNVGTWANNKLYTYTYDANHNRISSLKQIWNGNIWVNSSLDSCTYDGNNNLTNRLTYQLSNSNWIITDQYSYSYDVNNFKISDSHKQWDSIATITGGDSIYYYYYTVVGVNNMAMTLKSVRLYPNPSTEKITIESPTKGTISIYNTTGQKLLQQEITEPITVFDVSRLKSSVYIVMIFAAEGVQIGKFVKQ